MGQEDLLSLYLVVLVIEYLHRTLLQLRHEPRFYYHRRCEKLGVFHICFAYDLLMGCRADIESIKLLVHTFQYFSEVSGLQPSLDRISTYIAGVFDQAKNQIMSEVQM